MRRDFSKQPKSPLRPHSKWPFFITLAVILVVASGFVAWYLLRSNELAAQQAADAKKLQQLDDTIAKIKARLAAEKKARDEAAAKAKAASDAALKTGAVPAPSTQAVRNAGPHTDPSRPDVVVNKKHPLMPISYTPSVTDVDCAGNGTATINTLASSDFTALCQAAAAAGMPLGVSSSYRSYATQISTYNYWVSQSGVAGADTYSARPGYSEHQTGFAIDFRVPSGPALSEFTGTAQQRWLAVHAPAYGFIQRYTEANSSVTGYNAESWHYRYIGRENASKFAASGKSSLEEFWNISGGLY